MARSGACGHFGTFDLQVHDISVDLRGRNAIHQLYGSILALCNVFASARNSLIFSLHLSLLTFTALAVYAYRDIWPLMTFTLQPKDSAEGELLWAKIGLLIFVGGIVPLFEPYPYIPCDPSVSPAATGIYWGL